MGRWMKRLHGYMGTGGGCCSCMGTVGYAGRRWFGCLGRGVCVGGGRVTDCLYGYSATCAWGHGGDELGATSPRW